MSRKNCSLNTENLLKYLRKKFCIEKYIYYKNSEAEVFDKKWAQWRVIFE